MSSLKYLDFPEYHSDHPNLLRQMILVGKGVMQGKTNNTDTFTLSANATSTTLTLPKYRLGSNTVIVWQPTTANAAGAMTNLYVSARDVRNATLTLTHSNTSTTDRTFLYALIG